MEVLVAGVEGENVMALVELILVFGLSAQSYGMHQQTLGEDVNVPAMLE